MRVEHLGSLGQLFLLLSFDLLKTLDSLCEDSQIVHALLELFCPLVEQVFKVLDSLCSLVCLL